MISPKILPFAVGVVLCIGSAQGQWRKADLTWYESYCTTQSECEDYNGKSYAGLFAFVSGKKSLSWVKSNRIISIHGKDAQKYKLKTFEIRKGGKKIKAKVYDSCSDKDCGGCCTKNLKKTNFLIDMEYFTAKKFGAWDGVVEWRCLDC